MNLIHNTFRSSLHMDVLDTLDSAESVYRDLDRMTADQLGLTVSEFELLKEKTGSAYRSLCEARYVTDADASKVAAMRER